MKISQHLSEFVVRMTDLAEAEGRVLHRVLETAWVRVWLTIVAALAIAGGGGLVIAGIWQAIARAIGPEWGPASASIITGMIGLLAGGAALTIAGRLGKRP